MANDKLTWVELRKVVAETAHISEQEAGQFLNALLEGVMEGLKADKQVKIKGIGTFALKAVAPRKSVNIATGESITIEGYNKLTFNAESVLKENVEKRLEQPKTEAVVAELVNDPIKKLGEQADEIVDILAELGQAVQTENGKVKTGNEEVKTENEEIEPVEEPVEKTIEEPTEETVGESVEKVVEEEKPIAEEPINKPTCKPTCKCHKWVCWVIGVLLLLGIVGVGIYFRATLIQWWQCMQDCRPVAENVEEVLEVEEVPEVVTLADKPREYVNFMKIEEVGKDSRLAWIAYKYYGQKDLWVFIYEANRDIISHPSKVRPGQYIRIPELSEEYRNLYNPELRELVDSLAVEYLKK
ncbi:MAG: HU family DNA-binding protein [Paludibacteraceae bacterium]|nr:HU family DNA-binding protein [Paludibacteraceae bacterium]